MATIRKRPGPRGRLVYQAQVIRRGYPAKYRTFDSHAEAVAWSSRVESEMHAGSFRDFTPAERTLVSEVLDRYAREILPQQRGGSHAGSHLKALRKSLGSYSLAALSPLAIARHRDHRLDSVSNQTARHDLAILRRILNIATKEWGYFLPHGNPVEQVKLPAQSRARERRLMPGEEERLLAAARSVGGDIHDVVILALETGMRRGELSDIRWERVHWEISVLSMPPGAENKPDRNVPLSRRVRELLRTRWEAGGKPQEGTVWRGLRHPDSITQAFGRICEQAGIEDLRFHDLRHEATSRFFEKGLNPMEVAAITGHKTLQMLKRYTHLRAEELVQRLG